MLKITGKMLSGIARSLPYDRADMLADLHNEICPKYNITDEAEYREFIAQCAHESQEYSHKSENLNYSEQGLLHVFGRKYFNSQSAAICAHNPQKIANLVYACRMGNGNISSGDGWKFRGGGFIGATGRDMYTRFGKYLKYSGTVEALAEQVRTDDRYALEISCWIFAIDKSLLDEAEAGDIVAITKRINGGVNGLQQREAYEALAKKLIVATA